MLSHNNFFFFFFVDKIRILYFEPIKCLAIRTIINYFYQLWKTEDSDGLNIKYFKFINITLIIIKVWPKEQPD